MPYEYRKLTPEQRTELVRQRQASGFPLHAPPHPLRQAGTYLITAANFEHAHIMSTPERRTEFERQLVKALRDVQADVAGWTILANHYHVLVGVDSLDQVSAALKQLHGLTAREWNLADALTGKRSVWYKFTDRMIRDNAHYYRALNYIHFNPVKHGYVVDAYEWPWSSLSLYADDLGQDWLRKKWRTFQPSDDFGNGWDD